jgi:long-chain acyl-CoA synthetase
MSGPGRDAAATPPVPAGGPALEYHLGHRATEHPDRPAVIMSGSGEVTTYRMLDERSSRLAHALREAGLRTGDHLAVMMENSSALLEVTWAAQRAGLYYTALNSHLGHGEVQHILDDCGAEAFFVSARLGEVAGRLTLDRVRFRVAVGGQVPGFEPYDRVLARGVPTPVDDEAEGREMLYSSGTTGVPKGVRKTLTPGPPGDPESAPVQIATFIGARGIGNDAVYLSPAPLYHSAPLVYCMAVHRLGGTCVVMESFDAAQCLGAIERYRVTHAQFVPTMFTRMLRLPEEERLAYDLSSLEWAVHAAAPCPIPVKQQMLAWWGPIIHEYYAGTEDIGSSQITPEEWLTHPGSVGRPLGEVHIVGPDDEEVPVGQTGTVYFAGGRPFEYHNDPEKTAGMRNAQGWRTLGDVGHLDQDGYLYLTDRASDMVVSGGVNIYPREAELALTAHPRVADAAVFGVPDDEMGESLLAVVQPDDPADPPGPDELLAWCREHLATYKCPRAVTFIDALPRDPSGKLFKRLLRDPYWEGRSSRIV